MGFSQTIVKKHLSSCDKNSIPDYVRNRIVSKEITNDTLYLTVGFTGNCSMRIQPQLIASNDTLFLTLTNISDIFATCDCCYELGLIVTEIPNKNFTLVYQYHGSAYTTEMVGNNPFTIEVDTLLNEVLTEQPNKFIFPLENEFRNIEVHNQLTPEGLRTGLWYKYDTTRVRLRKIFTIKYAYFFAPPVAGKENLLWYVHLKEDWTVLGMSVYNSFGNSWRDMDGTTYYRLIGKTE